MISQLITDYTPISRLFKIFNLTDKLGIKKNRLCSFSPATVVATEYGLVPIQSLRIGQRVLAYDEQGRTTTYFTILDAYAHEHAVTVDLIISGELIETTPEHPFYELLTVPWLMQGEYTTHWTPAGDLEVGDLIRRANGGIGVVEAIQLIDQPQVMYNLTVDQAHTFFVGNGQWLVHNACYRKTFFDAYPDLQGKVVVHHAIEQQILKRYPGLFTEEEINAF